MADENVDINPNEETQQTPQQIIDDLRANTVPRQDFQNLQTQYTNLLAAYSRGERGESNPQDNQSDEERLKELRQILMSEDVELTNLEYISDMLEMREIIMRQGGDDPFVPQGAKYSPTAADKEIAQKVAEGLQFCVDECEGDSARFMGMYNSIVKDPILPTNKRR